MNHRAAAHHSGTRTRISRSGTVLIIVAGLSSILLALSVTFMARMRSDSLEVRTVVADAQARLMLHASLMYLQECSRIGWGDATGECFGWTDIRDGGIGPRGPRPTGAVSSPFTPAWAPAWYTGHPGWPTYRADMDDADLPAPISRRGGWPLPGTATRCPMAVPKVPPYATQLTLAYNAVPLQVPYGDASWDTAWGPTAGGWPWWKADWAPTGANWIPRIYDSNAKGLLDPQPVKSTYAEFVNGSATTATNGDWPAQKFDPVTGLPTGGSQQLEVLPGTENESWFRIYRETQKDHDGNPNNIGNPGTEWWDHVAMYDGSAPKDSVSPPKRIRNWSVFIVACGAGGTHGYRFWDDADISVWETKHGLPGYGRAIEPVTASESGLFANERLFRDMLASSRILWFRCEWSAMQSGARDMAVYNYWLWGARFSGPQVATIRPYMQQPEAWDRYVFKGGYGPNYTGQYANTEVRMSSDANESDLRTQSPKVFGGNIKWLQRLDRDPVLW